MNSIKTFTYIYHLHIYIFLNTFITTYLLELNLYGITNIYIVQHAILVHIKKIFHIKRHNVHMTAYMFLVSLRKFTPVFNF